MYVHIFETFPLVKNVGVLEIYGTFHLPCTHSFALTKIGLQPKYWCKHCKTFVRDTKLEKTNHEATPKHQGNLKRFLRDLHRGHEREERDKELARREVERVNGVVAGTGTATGPESLDNSGSRRAQTFVSHQVEIKITPEERKRQLAQLVNLGVAVPETYRPALALSGEWHTVSETIIEPQVKEESDVKPDQRIIGVRKRKRPDGEQDAEDTAEGAPPRNWGATRREYPEDEERVHEQLESILRATAPSGSDSTEGPSNIKAEDNRGGFRADLVAPPRTILRLESETQVVPAIKEEITDDKKVSMLDADLSAVSAGPIPEDAVFFKKRKSKPLRKR